MWGQPPSAVRRAKPGAGLGVARVGRTLLSVAFDVALDFDCHPEEAELHAKRATPDEGPMHLFSPA